MQFKREYSPVWNNEIPGSRWFKADFHVHTIDDLPGGTAKMPSEIAGSPSDPAVLRSYAEALLRAAVTAGVQVIGLTPHGTKTSSGPETCAVWHIVDAWNDGVDRDGVPFRSKIYAVFPGFEPNINDGASGVHALFLFDPEVGRDQYLSLFDAVMDGRAPWNGAELKMTSRDAREILATVDERRDDSRAAWDYMVLAPHFHGPHGLLHEVKSQVLEAFPCERLAGYELGDQQLPSDFTRDTKPGSFLLPFMEKHRQAFFHASDAFHFGTSSPPAERHLGYRSTWLKLASPRIEAIRQAFVANDSRMRLCFEREKDDRLHETIKPPDPVQSERPWLRRLTVSGEASFFGGREGTAPKSATFDLSPDLTCVIGGSMTGKSTLLDGLRVHIMAEMPSDDRLREGVEARGRGRFLAGQPIVELDTPGRPVGSLGERWPAVFFTQNELQRLAQDPGAVEEVLTPLVPGEQPGLRSRAERLRELDQLLGKEAKAIGELIDSHAEAEQQLSAAKEASKALEAFKQAGLETMQETETLQSAADALSKAGSGVHKELQSIVLKLQDPSLSAAPEAEMEACLERAKQAAPERHLAVLRQTAVDSVRKALEDVAGWVAELSTAQAGLRRASESDRESVEKRLAELGYSAEKLAEFKTLNSRSGTTSRCNADLDRIESVLSSERIRFQADQSERQRIIQEQREALDRVGKAIDQLFERKIRVRRIDFGISRSLEGFLQSFRQKGITQWWNSLDANQLPSPETILEKLKDGRLADIGVSSTVADRLLEVLTEARRLELSALRSSDRYVLELRVGESDYRDIAQLSGGRKVSLLLALLLQASDSRPLVIDQPEDELDNRFLWETVLPALRRLKGKRQVIVATHSANIVVNGDADLVVHLEADAEHGRVSASGAIENDQVRKAIIDTVDGGERAFELRKAKYGF